MTTRGPAPGGGSRRQFLARCAGCAVAAPCGLTTIGRTARAQTTPSPSSRAGRPRIRVVFSHVPPGRPTWPYITYDYETRKQTILRALNAGCPELEFVPATAHSGDETKAVMASDKDIDGIMAIALGLWTGSQAAVIASGKPAVIVDDLYGGSGEFLIAYAGAKRAGRDFVGVSSSRLDDVVTAARCFATIKAPGASASFTARCREAVRKTYGKNNDLAPAPGDAPPKVDTTACLAKLKESTIVVVGSPMHAIAAQIQQTLGPRVVPVDYKRLDSAYKAADRDETRAIADRWIKGAEAVVEPSTDDVVKSAAMYLGMKAIMKENHAEAIAINCLGGFYGGQMAAYPCLGFCQFNDDGLVGACEADMQSTITMLTMTHLVGRPGYISDPVIDTSKNQIIYAHCVAPRKVFGPEGPSNGYQIRSHSEDRKGASVRSLLPLGHITTTIEISPVRKQILMHQGKTVENVDEDKACRTKLAATVKGDIEKLMCQWDQWGWHRVTFYGDLKDPVCELADRIGFKVVEEA
jgi:hypothetical protein